MSVLDPNLERLRQLLVEEIRATRRHFDVVAESLRSDIKLVAEGVVAVDEKLERFRGEVREQFGKIDRRFTRLEARAFLPPDRPA